MPNTTPPNGNAGAVLILVFMLVWSFRMVFFPGKVQAEQVKLGRFLKDWPLLSLVYAFWQSNAYFWWIRIGGIILVLFAMLMLLLAF